MLNRQGYENGQYDCSACKLTQLWEPQPKAPRFPVHDAGSVNRKTSREELSKVIAHLATTRLHGHIRVASSWL